MVRAPRKGGAGSVGICRWKISGGFYSACGDFPERRPRKIEHVSAKYGFLEGGGGNVYVATVPGNVGTDLQLWWGFPERRTLEKTMVRT